MKNLSQKYREITILFIKLGAIAFGGPAAHIALMEDEVVHKRKWMSQQHFLDLVGATNLIPGPNSTEMAIHCGFHRGGWLGLILAGVCFILPATLITGLLAWFYVSYQTLPELNYFLVGIKPAVIAIILIALFRLGKKAFKNWQLIIIGLGVAGATLAGLNEILMLLMGGIIGGVWLAYQKRSSSLLKSLSLLPLLTVISAKVQFANPILANSLTAKSLLKIFLIFLKIGSVLFGSGYVLIAYLDGELVNSLQWLTKDSLLDAVAIGQLTPGPILSTATFIGYQLAGFGGAFVATAGIFLPSFLLVAVINPIVPKLRQSTLFSTFLDAVNASAIGLMVAVTINLGKSNFTSWKPIAILLMVTGILFFTRGKIGALWLVLLGGVVGYLLSLLPF